MTHSIGLAAALTSLAICVAPAVHAGAPRPEAPTGQRDAYVRRIAVFGSDDRTNVPARLEAAASKLGLLFNNKSRTVCSAFCVAENVIATAAHCLHRAHSGATARHADFVFARNFDRTREMVKIDGAVAGSATQNMATGDFKMRVRPPIDAAHDWALVRLERNACPGGGLAVQALSNDDVIEHAKGGRVFQVSYHRDWAQWRPAYSKPCLVARDYEKAPWSSIAPDFMLPEQVVLHTCDTGGASSGSPLLLETAQGPAVIGINVGTYVQSKMSQARGQAARQRSDTIANTAVNATAFASLIQPLSAATMLTSGQAIRELQERLKGRSHYAGKIDGTYGPMLKAAIEAHERASRLPVTGLATQTLLQSLASEPERAGTVAPSSATEAMPPAR